MRRTRLLSEMVNTARELGFTVDTTQPITRRKDANGNVTLVRVTGETWLARDEWHEVRLCADGTWLVLDYVKRGLQGGAKYAAQGYGLKPLRSYIEQRWPA